jgi:hypothetical protein
MSPIPAASASVHSLGHERLADGRTRSPVISVQVMRLLFVVETWLCLADAACHEAKLMDDTPGGVLGEEHRPNDKEH